MLQAFLSLIIVLRGVYKSVTLIFPTNFVTVTFPIPLTLTKSVIVLNSPLRSRHWIICTALYFPMPGKAVSSSSFAVLIFSGINDASREIDEWLRSKAVVSVGVMSTCSLFILESVFCYYLINDTVHYIMFF